MSWMWGRDGANQHGVVIDNEADEPYAEVGLTGDGASAEIGDKLRQPSGHMAALRSSPRCPTPTWRCASRS
ncbi:MAG TPA: hypothetical protein VHN14_00675 [Kofleriaceae bacterium]|jgi:hypothetical protein|nr:hypothetical protein [Kofleriaceae bacterium]